MFAVGYVGALAAGTLDAMWATLAAIAGAIATVTAAVAAVRRWARPLRRAWKRITQFLDDWNGEQGRPGRDPVPSFPERMTAQEQGLAELNGYSHELSHFVRSDLASRMQLLQLTADRQQLDTAEHGRALEQLSQRVTDHRRRNDEQISVLQQAVNDLRREQREQQ